jgi:hypothetical protein
VEIVKLHPEVGLHPQYVYRTGPKNQGSEEQHGRLTALAQAVAKPNRLEAIILVGADFPLLFNETNTDFPRIDSAAFDVKRLGTSYSARLLLNPTQVNEACDTLNE